MTRILPALAAVLPALALFAADNTLHTFKKIQLSEHFWCEGASFGDFNRDGRMDIVSGPYWYAGPDFKQRHEYYPADRTFKKANADGSAQEIPGFEGALGSKNTYSDNFFAFTHDFNQDGWTDILILGFPGKEAIWYENPKGKPGHWKRHVVFDVVDNESPTFADLTGDGRPEIICQTSREVGNATPANAKRDAHPQPKERKGRIGYVTPDWSDPTKPWTFHPISHEDKKWQRFTHGLGMGDVNGDGRLDILERDGWWEQPASLAGDPVWKFHAYPFAPGAGGAQMYVYDVNGDGRNDVITSLAAHGFGLAWYEQLAEQDEKGGPKFRQHTFMNKEPGENRYGVKFSQLHAIAFVDMDGDGLKDIVTGKRFWAHGPTGDPEPGAPAVVYWFKLVRNADKSVDWVPHLIDDNSGVGTQLVVGDVSGNKLPDVVVGNKKGTFVFLHEAKKVGQEEWEKAQPKPQFSVTDQQLSRDQIVTRTGPPRGATAASAVQANPAIAPGGVRPVGADGKPLNLDFETGDLRDWTAAGNAFDKQPMAGDVVAKRRPDMSSRHAGRHWIGTYEIHRDLAKGTLTSKPFKVTHPWAAFLVAGGAYENTRVDLVEAGKGAVFFTTTGFDGAQFAKKNNASESLSPVVVDLRPHQGKEIFIRLVDQHTGHWGHLNFDDFKFYSEQPDFGARNVAARPALKVAAAAPATAPAPAAKPAAPQDDVKFAGLSPEDAAREMELPPGFKAHVFAAEPDVKQPIAFTIDDRGRLWVIECYDYPLRPPDGEGTDRILVFEDTNGDHKFDRRTVFYEGLSLATGIEYGFGGVWVGAAPYLMFIPIDDRGDVPKAAGKPRILLEGWAYQDTHETLNSFTWGPDGWLYGCHGVFTHSHVKKPGDPDSTRQFINAGIWRYHPTQHKFEVFAEGTSNPWGLDFNEYGHAFIEACVIPHFWHVIQGARYHRQAGQHYPPSIEETLRVAPEYFQQDFSKANPERPVQPFIFDDIKTHGDHVHYLGEKPHAGNNRSDAAGGGHAHQGLMVYLGDSWPAEYRGKVFMNNTHGQRINMDIPERRGSGYVGKHGPDFANAHDKWSQILNFRCDQDGSVYVIDWYDGQQCHNQRDPTVHDRSNGRIFKIVYGDTKRTPTHWEHMDDETLVIHLLHRNGWYAAHAQRSLQEHAANRKLEGSAKDWLRYFAGVAAEMPTVQWTLPEKSRDPKSEPAKLRAIWASFVTGVLTEADLLKLLASKEENVRAWAVQLLCEEKKPSDSALRQFAQMAKEDSSPLVRLYLASAMQRTPVEKRLPILEGLLARAEDAQDHNLPLMYWYATEPVVADVGKAVVLLGKTKIPLIREYITRRMTLSAGTGN